MLRLEWSPRALQQLDEMIGYIAERNRSAAERMESRFQHVAERLTTFPYLHRSGRVAGTREAVVHPNYIMVYRVEEQIVRILSVLHTRQQYPRISP